MDGLPKFYLPEADDGFGGTISDPHEAYADKSDLSIAIDGKGGSKLMPRIVAAINAHDALVLSLGETLAIVRLQCGNLHDDTNAIQARAEEALRLASTGEA